MVTHFIDTIRESVARYHNNRFDSSNLSHEFLFARFVWVIIKNAHAAFMSHSAASRKAFSLKTADAAPLDEENEAVGQTMEMETNFRIAFLATFCLTWSTSHRLNTCKLAI